MSSLAARLPLLGQGQGGALALRSLLGGNQGLFLDFLNDDALIVDGATPANNYRGKASSKLTFTRASTATRFNSAGQLETVDSGALRIDYDPVTRVKRGLLMEGARTNLFWWSEDFANAAWGKTGTTVSGNQAVAPDGATTADLVTRQTGTASYMGFGASPAAGTYTLSFFAKAATLSSGIGLRIQGTYPNRVDAIFNLNTGAVVGASAFGTATAASASIQNCGNGWYRCILTGTLADTMTTAVAIATDATATIGAEEASQATAWNMYLWGAQLEAGAIPSTYIPTTSATVTRAAETCTISASLFPVSLGSHTLFVKAIQGVPNPTGDSSGRAYLGLGDASANSSNINRAGSSANINGQVTSASVQTVNQFMGASTYGLAFKAAMRVASNDQQGAFNGALATADTSVTPIAAATLAAIGTYPSLASPAHGWIQQIAVIPAALTNAQLQAITS